MPTLNPRVFYHIAKGYLQPLKIDYMKSAVSFEQKFRLTPVDMLDTFHHLNNVMFFRVAELSRYRFYYQSGILSLLSKGNHLLVVEQDAKYSSMLDGFLRPYIVRTQLTVLENKWLVFKHLFVEDESTVKTGKEPRVFCEVSTKVVLKEPTRKTIKIDELKEHSEVFKVLNESN